MMSAMLHDNIAQIMISSNKWSQGANKNPILIDRAEDGQKRAKRPYIKASRQIERQFIYPHNA